MHEKKLLKLRITFLHLLRHSQKTQLEINCTFCNLNKTIVSLKNCFFFYFLSSLNFQSFDRWSRNKLKKKKSKTLSTNILSILDDTSVIWFSMWFVFFCNSLSACISFEVKLKLKRLTQAIYLFTCLFCLLLFFPCFH